VRTRTCSELRRHERVGRVDRRSRGFVQPVIQRVAYDADDLQPPRGPICRERPGRESGEFGHAQRMTQGITAGQVVTHERLIHEDECGAPRDFTVVPHAAAEEWDSQGCEVLGADEFYFSLLRLGSRFAQNLDRQAPAAVGRSGIGGNTGGKDARHFRDFVAEFGEEAGTIRPGRVRIFADGNYDRHHVLRFIAERRRVHANKALNGRAGGGHQQQSEGDLAGNQGGVQASAFHAARQPLRVPACMTWLISGRADCRAGKRPKTIPLSNARPTLKNRTAKLMWKSAS
jgi:hypothetical protein